MYNSGDSGYARPMDPATVVRRNLAPAFSWLLLVRDWKLHRFVSQVNQSVELDFDRSFGIFDMNVVVQIDNKINAKSFETIGVKIKKINNVKNKRLLVRHERG